MQLQYKLKDLIKIDNKEYIVNASFDVILRIFDLLDDETISSNERVEVALIMLINSKLEGYTIEEKADILKQILKEYVHLEKKKIYDISGEEMPDFLFEQEQERVIDYNEDSDLIYSAFMQVYKIDLIEEQGKLHWSKFQALLNGLPDTTVLSKIIEIRTWSEEDEKKDYKQQRRMLKNKYKLRG